MKFTKDYSAGIDRLKKEIQTADAIIIGAGAGLSTAAGFTYSGERMQEYFGDFVEKYGFQDMYSGGFYPFETPEELWAYWSRYIYINRYMDVDNGTYRRLFELVKDKDYFVLTTNVDHQFQKAGFDKHRLFYTQGDYGLWQCSEPCHQKTYDNEETVRAMFERQKDMRVPSELVPKCPVCGREMTTNLRSDDRFVEDEGWRKAAIRYTDFLEKNSEKRVLFLELGVGFNTPSVIKYPFIRMTFQFPDAFYVCINKGRNYIPDEIADKSMVIDDDIASVLEISDK